MKRIGYSLIDINAGTEFAWSETLPWSLTYPVGEVTLDKLGEEIPDRQNASYRLVERVCDPDEPPAGYRFVGWESPTYDAGNNRVVVTPILEALPPPREPTPPSQADLDDAVRQLAVNTTTILAATKLVNDETVSATDKARLIALYHDWTVGVAVTVGSLVRYNDSLYKCVQAHTTQADWTPSATPALWSLTVEPGTVGPWRQPLGAFDAYPLGAVVTHNGQTWVAFRDANVWEPGTQDSGWYVKEVPVVSPPPGHPEWVQPTGAQDAYAVGAIVTHNGQTWINTATPANVWEPGVYGWDVYAG